MYRKNTGNAFRDVFISYKNDNAGNNFASRLTDDLEEAGYSVYFNSDEQKGGSFPERLRENVQNCKDFVLIVSQGCLDQLLRFEDVDWIREELLTAHESGKHIIPVILENVKMPSDEAVFYCKKEDKEYDLRFLIRFDYVFFTEKYKVSPFEKFTGFLNSRKEKDDTYRDVFNDNPWYNVQEAYERTVREANEGSAEAMYRGGVMCFYGYYSSESGNSQRDYEQAIYWFRRVTESADASPDLKNAAYYYISKMYYAGNVPKEGQSYFKAFEYRKKAESQISCAVQVAWMQRDGLGCKYDYSVIDQYFQEKIMPHGDDIAKADYAKFLCMAGKYAEAIEVYDQMEHLSVESAYKLGQIYKDGIHQKPPKQDYYKASYYFQDAADRGHINASFELAMLVFRPFENNRKNFTKALRYFTVAADHGHEEAQYMLGYMYENGHVQRDYEKAIVYYEKAASTGHPLASLQLARLYQEPQVKNYHKAFRHAQKSMEGGCAEAEYILGNLLLFGRGCQYDMDEAYRHYQNACEHGIDAAYVMMQEIEDMKLNLKNKGEQT